MQAKAFSICARDVGSCSGACGDWLPLAMPLKKGRETP